MICIEEQSTIQTWNVNSVFLFSLIYFLGSLTKSLKVTTRDYNTKLLVAISDMFIIYNASQRWDPKYIGRQNLNKCWAVLCLGYNISDANNNKVSVLLDKLKYWNTIEGYFYSIQVNITSVLITRVLWDHIKYIYY